MSKVRCPYLWQNACPLQLKELQHFLISPSESYWPYFLDFQAIFNRPPSVNHAENFFGTKFSPRSTMASIRSIVYALVGLRLLSNQNHKFSTIPSDPKENSFDLSIRTIQRQYNKRLYVEPNEIICNFKTIQRQYNKLLYQNRTTVTIEKWKKRNIHAIYYSCIFFSFTIWN